MRKPQDDVTCAKFPSISLKA